MEQPVRMRSWLFTPSTRPERFGKAADAGADVAILDLEDSVAPQSKAQARSEALSFLSTRPAGVAYALRINAMESAAGMADLDALLAANAEPDFLVVPKTESPEHLHVLDLSLRSTGKATRLIAQIESAQGLAAAEAIATSGARLAGIMLGAADMAADLGCDLSWDALAYVRSRIVAACALGDLRAIDTPFFNFQDEGALRAETTRAAGFGFSGKAAIHPSQIAAINETFTPTPSAIENARAVLAENLKGVGAVDGTMVDEAMARRARRILAAAGLMA